jgi:predicted nuclease of predicted toxin-antitoxin system
VKLLFDQNISFRIISKISHNFPEARQVLELGIENYSDQEILEFAKENQYTIITFDADFYDLSTLKESPPKLIWLRFGNIKTDFIANKLNSKHLLIKDFINAREYEEIVCLEINK